MAVSERLKGWALLSRLHLIRGTRGAARGEVTSHGAELQIRNISNERQHLHRLVVTDIAPVPFCYCSEAGFFA